MVDVLKMRLVREDMRDQIMKIPFAEDRARGGGRGSTVCIEESLVWPLQICLETTNLIDKLKEKNVNQVLTLSPDEFNIDDRKVIYIVRPRLDLMKVLARHIKHLLQEDQRCRREYREIVVVLVPRKTLICEHILEEYRLLQHVDLRELEGVDLFPVENDVLSMEMEFTFRELKLDGDTSSLYYIAKSVKKLQEFFGQIPKVRGKGYFAERVCQMLDRMRIESGDAGVGQTPEIDSVYFIDRDVDLLTPLMTQVTYEGLIDELYGIDRGRFMPDFEVKQAQAKDGTQQRQ
eukprot:gene10673-22221_t